MQVFLYYLLSYYMYVCGIAFLVFFISLILYLIKQKVLYKRVFVGCLAFVVLCFVFCFIEHMGGNFSYARKYSIMEAVFVKTDSGRAYILNKDGLVKYGDYYGSIMFANRIVDLGEVSDLCVKQCYVNDSFDFQSGDVVSVLVKHEVRTWFTDLFSKNRRVLLDLSGGSSFGVCCGDVVSSIKIGNLSSGELRDYILGMDGDFQFSCYVSDYGDYFVYFDTEMFVD